MFINCSQTRSSFPSRCASTALPDIDPQNEAEDIRSLRNLGGQVQDILHPIPGVQTVQNDWFAESPEVRLGQVPASVRGDGEESE